MTAQPIISQHALQRAADRRNWKDAANAIGQIQAIFRRGERIGCVPSRKHRNASTVHIIDRLTRTVLAYKPEDNVVATLMTAESLKVDVDTLVEYLPHILAMNETDRASKASYLASERDLMTAERESILDKLTRVQAQYNALRARLAAIDATIAEYESEIDALDEKQMRLVRSLAAVKLS